MHKIFAFLLLVVATVSCGDITADPIQMNLAEQLWDIQIERRSITMSTVAPYDTLTLRTIAFNGFGDTIPGNALVTYHSITDTTVRINDKGVLTVRSPTDVDGIKIAARVTYNNVTRTDTAIVIVTTEPSPPFALDTIVLETIDNMSSAPRSPTWSIAPDFEGNPAIVPFIHDSDGPVIDVPIDYVSSDPSIAVVDPRTGEITPKLEGTARITATTTWYGKTYRTTLDMMVVGALTGFVWIQERIPRGSDTAVFVITPATLVVETGALVSWNNESSRHVDLIFDNPTNVRQIPGRVAEVFDLYCRLIGQGCNTGKTGGNLSLPASDPEGDPTGNLDMRYFPVPGTYRYRTPSGVTGTVTVK